MSEHRIHRARRGVAPGVLVLSVLLALLAGGGIGVWAGRATDHPAAATGSSSDAPSGAAQTSTTAAPASSTSTTAPPALTVSSISPASSTADVPAGGPFVVRFSAPLATGSPLPTLSPATGGRWSVSGSTAVFRPSAPLIPLSTVRITVPAGVRAADGARLAAPDSSTFEVQDGSIVRLQQLLSLLDYSPLAFSSPAEPGPATPAAQRAALYHPPAGHFAWRSAGWPAGLRAMWTEGAYNLFTKGLVMSFQADHGLPTNGARTEALWADLLSALATGESNHGGYNYALASKRAPERLTVYHDGQVVIRSPANSGIAASPTPDGTFAVYTRLRRQVMRGTNPDGSKYADLVQYIAYFHGNDAVHYMPRADYGIPQSLGCIELPLTEAAKVWPYLAYGTLVTITG